MIELLLDGIIADITEDIDISLTYQMNDFSNPQAVKNSYSKSVELKGTKNNNRIFGHIFNLDKEIVNGNGLIGSSFNPNLRVPYIIKNDGDVVDSGYFKLDEIKVLNGDITYSVTLYGTIGDFFYNLMYDEEEDEKNLASLYYGINRLSKQDEDTKTLFEYDLDFVDKTWKQRCNVGTYDKDSMYDIFCAIPTHSGLYDDFTSSKVLYNVDALSDSEKTYIPNEIVDGDSTYTPYQGYMLVEAPRDLEEYEIGDLRSHNQRLGMRIKRIYDAIKNPDNNGGYEVDDTFINDYSRKYLNDSYIVFNRFNYEDINDTENDIQITLSNNPIGFNDYNGNNTVSTTFDISNYLNPHISLYIVPQVRLTDTKITGDTAFTDYAFIPSDSFIYNTGVGYQGIPLIYSNWECFYVRYRQGNTVLSVSDVYVQMNQHNNLTEREKEIIDIFQYDKIFARVPEINRDSKRIIKRNAEYIKNDSAEVAVVGTNFVTEQPIGITESIPKNCDNIEVVSFISESHYSYWGDAKNNPSIPPQFRYDLKEYYTFEELKQTSGITVNPTVYVNNKTSKFNAYGYIGSTDEYTTAIYDGSVEKREQRHIFTKKTLFIDTKSPFDYLISLGKTLNWVFVPSLYEKKIYIYSKDKYYDRQTVNIDNYIDRSEYNIVPSTIEYKNYKVNIPTPETYAVQLFKQKNNRIYGQFIYKPKYQFSNESLELLEETVFTVAEPYTMHSVYFTNRDGIIPTAALGSSYTVSGWKKENNELNIGSKKYSGTLIREPKQSVETNEYNEKLCCFDMENSSVTDFNNMICVFSGIDDLTQSGRKKMYLSNDCKLIEQLADDKCYIINPSGQSITSMTSSATEEVTRRITYMPLFNVSNNDISLICNEEEDKTNNNIYNLFFRKDIEQFYNKNSKVLTVRMQLREQPQKAMRHFYVIDNALWVMNKITDYKPQNEELTEVEFVRISNENYCQS